MPAGVLGPPSRGPPLSHWALAANLLLQLLLLLAPVLALTHYDGSTEGPVHQRVLCLGDSITEGWSGSDEMTTPYAWELVALALEEGVNGLQVSERGISGEPVVPTMTNRCSKLLAEAHAAGNNYTHVLILGGVNDFMWSATTVAQVFAGLVHMYKEVEGHGAHVVGMTIFQCSPIDPCPPEYEVKRRQLNTLIREFFTTHPAHTAPGHHTQHHRPQHHQLVDLDLLMTPATMPTSYWLDFVHPSAAGYKFMGKLLWEHVLTRHDRPHQPLQVQQRPDRSTWWLQPALAGFILAAGLLVLRRITTATSPTTSTTA